MNHLKAVTQINATLCRNYDFSRENSIIIIIIILLFIKMFMIIIIIIIQ